MKKNFVLFLIVLCIALSTGCTRAIPNDKSQNNESLTVFAAASLTEPFKEIGTLYSRKSGVQVRYNFDGSSGLQLQLNQGARADVFASADESQMQKVAENAGVIEPAQIFIHNNLVVIVPSQNRADINKIDDLARPGVKLVLAHEAVPAGKYARQMINKASELPEYGVDFADQVFANIRSEETNVKQVVLKVQLGEADAGIVYRSDVTPAVQEQIHLITIPESLNPTASYPIAPIKNSKQPELATDYIKFVLSEEGQAILAKHGFLPVTRSEQ